MDGQPFGEDFDWATFATTAGEVGRFIWYLDTAEYEVDKTLMEMTGLQDPGGRFPANHFIDQIHFEDQSLVWLALNEALVTRCPYQTEFRFVREDGQVIWLVGSGQVKDMPGGGRALIGVNYDVSQKRILMQRSEMVAGEMEHRVKNLLAMVASIYRSTVRYADSIEDLSAAFLPRLTALASMNALAARSGHKEIDVDALVESAMHPATGRNVSWDVDPCYVNGQLAQTLALILNELMTNAMKYGGLADSSGKVSISVTTDNHDFTLVWQEHLKYELTAPVNPSGFGMEILNNMSAATCQGRPTMDWRRDGLCFTCKWPLDKVLV